MRSVQPVTLRSAAAAAPRARAAITRAPGGASSLLRLSAGAATGRLPTAAALGRWIGSAARSLAGA